MVREPQHQDQFQPMVFAFFKEYRIARLLNSRMSPSELALLSWMCSEPYSVSYSLSEASTVSLFSRSRSKKVELLARVYDHVSHKFVRGVRMLTLGWSDGNSFVPLAFSLLSSANERNRLCGVEDSIDKRTCGYMRQKERACKRQRTLCSNC